jgi:dihydrofolate reductase
MRRLILSMNITLDGFISGPHCELDWHFRYWTNEMALYAAQQLSRSDTIILGRVTFQAMSQHWPLIANNFSYPKEDIVFADMMNQYKKIVFSKSLKKSDPSMSDWPNATISKIPAASAILQLKKLPGKDMIVFGSGRLSADLIGENLVDEYLIWVHPVVLGKGKRLFHENHSPGLILTGTKKFESGVIVLVYAKAP